MLASTFFILWYLTAAFANAVLRAASFDTVWPSLLWPVLLIQWVFDF